MSIATIFQFLKTGVALGTIAGAATLVENALNPNTYADGKEYNKAQTVVFPSDLVNFAAGKVSYMIFNFYKYQRPSVFDTPTQTAIGSIILPLPNDLVDSQQLNYNEGITLGPGVGAAMDALAKVENGGMQQGNLGFQNLITEIGGGIAASGGINAADAILTKFGTNTKKTLQLAGLTTNPFMTVLFDSPNFKHHRFSWKFIPKNKREANTLKFILNKFKYHSLPDLSDSVAGTLLKYPDMVVPIISPTGYVYSFKHCMIRNVTVNYAPGSTPSFTRDLFSPSAIELSLDLLEIEYWLKRDIINGNNNYSVPSDLDLAMKQQQSDSVINSIPAIDNNIPALGTPGIITNRTNNVTTSLQFLEEN